MKSLKKNKKPKLRIPVAPPTLLHLDKKKYNRKKKHRCNKPDCQKCYDDFYTKLLDSLY